MKKFYIIILIIAISLLIYSTISNENISTDIKTTPPENISSDIETTLQENISSDIETISQENISSDIETLYIQNEKQIETTIFKLQYKDIIEIHGEPIEEKYFRIGYHTPPGRCLLLIYDDIQYFLFNNNLDSTKEELKRKNEFTKFLITSKSCMLNIDISVGMSLDEFHEKNQFIKMNNILLINFEGGISDIFYIPYTLPTEFEVIIEEKINHGYVIFDENIGEGIILIFDNENTLQCILAR